jgi:hypothetical protein
MKVKTLQIYWHDKQPIFSVDFEPIPDGRIATSGADGCVRVRLNVGVYVVSSGESLKMTNKCPL